MGQAQSAGTDEAAADASPNNTKQCYYEVLGIVSDATEDDIKKAYRKKALELHPDRNFGNVEQTTSLFAELQTAYEVLSDPQERTWYDSNRDTILGRYTGNEEAYYEGNVRVTTTEDITRLYVNFNGRLNLSDATSGLFLVLREFFDQLASEEALACKRQGLESTHYPSFGSSHDTYEDTVRTFYGIWSSFSTAKTFAWKDIYRSHNDSDRRTRRFIEKENKRSRDDGIRDFNNAVRALVAFVRKRDPRFLPNKQSEEERQKMLRDMSAAQAARSRAANVAKAASQSVPEWAKVQSEDAFVEFDEPEEDEQQHVECVVCRKTFKSEKQFEAHEKSKKHLKASRHLLREMHKENEELGLSMSQLRSNFEGQGTDCLGSNADDKSKDHAQTAGTLLDEGEGKSAIYESGESAQTHTRTSMINDTSRTTVATSEDDTDCTAMEEVVRRAEPSDPETSVRDINNVAEKLSKHHLASANMPKLGKAKAKRAKKSAANGTASTMQSCVVCNELFESRSSLFRHINEHGHAAPTKQHDNSRKRK